MSSKNAAVKMVTEAAKKFAFRYTPLGVPNYSYCVEPLQLATLIFEIERLRDVEGAILEIGVARGLTTRFLAEHIVNTGRPQRLVAIDTFSSFVPSDVTYETEARGKKQGEIAGFAYNDYEVWKRNFSKFSFLTALQADCAKVDYQSLAPVKIVFLDVDLYLPTKKVLPQLMDVLVPGGVILIDDVRQGGAYDGAYQAYIEYCTEHGTAPEIIGNKCGVIRKP